MMKKPYEKPALIMERFDTGEVFCSDSDSDFCKRFLRAVEEAKKNPSAACTPLCGRTGCVMEKNL